MEPSRNSPSLEQQVVSDKNDIPSNTQQQEFSDFARFFVLKTPNTFSTVSPFLIEKAITSSIGPVKTIRKMRSGDLFLEVASAKQSSALRTLRKMAHIDITVVPHNTLNYSRGVISAADLLNVSTEEIKENMVDQKSVKAAYLHCPVRPYIPNPPRCFQCQRFGHSKTVCRGQPTCSRCAEARRVVSLRTPVSGKSYASAANKTYQTIAIQVDASTAPKSEQSESVKPTTIAVDTRKTVSTPLTVKD
ncbi:uncharacterized protein TNCV_3862861 [Trichonephila clavipes]|uniref:Gag-like protein n=1 Tax=Trichonephila clavipes TaxID=2585209 RepID=A0A8X6SAX8_TRICX|nr:uncharacterized protein TNCV_3862861 [Trichonephila clavipes]